MPAHYDTYDYPAYWKGRDYEHKSEVHVITQYLDQVKKVNKLLEIGTGYGRLYPIYQHRAKRIILTDPSAKLLKIARENIKDNKTKIVQSSLEKLPDLFKKDSFDLIIMVRVLHHISDIENALTIVNNLLKKNGYLIIEFPNKNHFKAVFERFLKGDFTFPIEIFPKDLRSKISLKSNKIPFYNYHVDDVIKTLFDCCFKVIDKRSVSNVRSSFIKKHISVENLLNLEKVLQKPLSVINFGPSIFLLCKKI